MAAPAYCPNCGRAQVSEARFCSNCGHSFEVPTSPTGSVPTSTHQGWAETALQAQSMMARLFVGRVIGLIAGGVLWWTIIGPAIGGNPIGQLAAIAVLGFGGILVGQTVVLMLLAGRR